MTLLPPDTTLPLRRGGRTVPDRRRPPPSAAWAARRPSRWPCQREVVWSGLAGESVRGVRGTRSWLGGQSGCEGEQTPQPPLPDVRPWASLGTPPSISQLLCPRASAPSSVHRALKRPQEVGVGDEGDPDPPAGCCPSLSQLFPRAQDPLPRPPPHPPLPLQLLLQLAVPSVPSGAINVVVPQAL